MKRFLILSGCLFLVLNLWSATAAAACGAWNYGTDPTGPWINYDWAYTNSSGTQDKLDAFLSGYPKWPDGNGCYWEAQTQLASGDTSDAYHRTWMQYRQHNPTLSAGTSGPPGPDTPAVCLERGEFWQESASSCVASCPSGSLDHYCLEQAPVGEPDTDENGNECTVSSPDYQGIFEGKHYCDSNLPEPATCPSGEMAYIQTGSDGSGAYVCGEPISSPDQAGDATDTETTTTTTDADGNTTTTTTDQDGNTTTTTDDGAGNSTTINNYPGTDSETGGPCTAESVACYPADDTEKGFCKDGGSLCDDVSDIKEAIDQESTRITKTGEFKTAEANTAVTTAETELTNGLNSIKAEIGGYFDLALSGGDMVCGPGVDVLGTTIQICPSEMKEELAVIAQIVMLIAGLISLMIIFR